MIAIFALLAALIWPTLPDATLTPGTVTNVSIAALCQPGYSAQVRNVPSAVKTEVFKRYGIARSGRFEVDHLVSLELGGSNAIENLWPQSYETTPYNARTKDALENRLHHLICAGQLSLRTAQDAIRSNWIAAYQTYVHATRRQPAR